MNTQQTGPLARPAFDPRMAKLQLAADLAVSLLQGRAPVVKETDAITPEAVANFVGILADKLVNDIMYRTVEEKRS